LKSLLTIALSLSLISTTLFAEEEQINPDTARAYQAYLVTFTWPENQSTEQVDYKNVLSTKQLLRLTDEDVAANDASQETDNAAPFGNIEEKIGRHVNILVNKSWTLIFKYPGDRIEKEFYSQQTKDNYPELTGHIAIKLGRYLESDIHYQHYLFDSFTIPDYVQADSHNTLSEMSASPFQVANTNTAPEFKEFEPALVLTLNQSNKTASKKVNYLDHPTIGTLLYFEPIELEDAIEKIALQTVAPETGASLNYTELESTNELSN
jgi:plasmid maintenance system killer protein